MSAPHRFRRSAAALLVVDIQERLAAAMDPERLARVVQRARAAILSAQALELPIVVTEQYAKGIGPTVPALREVLGSAPVFDKLAFSAATPDVLRLLQGRRDILVVGMETHVCVFQTTRDLAELGLVPYVARDAVLSRTPLDFDTGLALCERAGGVLTSVEAALFDALKEAGSPEFKKVSAAVK